MPLKVMNVEAATNGGVGMVDVSWTAEANRIIYLVEVALVTNGVAGVFTNRAFTSKIKCTVPNLNPGSTCQFRVISINNLGLSDASDVATAISL